MLRQYASSDRVVELCTQDMNADGEAGSATTDAPSQLVSTQPHVLPDFSHCLKAVIDDF